MVTPEMLRQKFSEGLEYDAYVATGSDSQRENWRRSREGVALDGKQRALVESFARDMKVLVVSGTWCGDCVRQCPMVHAIASANPRRIALRFVDRDRHLDLAERVMICGGLRVPTVLFLNEDFAFVSLLGDRTLASYRASAARQIGRASCRERG